MTYDENEGFPAEDETDVGIACTLDMFKEYDVVQQMISSIPKTSQKFITAEKGFEDFKTLLDQYQEQPHLLDPHLENLLNQLVTIIRDSTNSIDAISLAFKYLWLIVKVRGYKTIIKKMPHEVKDLIPVLTLLEKEEFQKDFYASYILLIWLSIIIYMPFNMTGFDISERKPELGSNCIPAATVVDRILLAIKKHLSAAQSSREMAAYLASRFVTRPDLRDKYLQDFINYCFEVLEHLEPKDPHMLFSRMGVLRSLGLIFKHGKREELNPFAGVVLTKFLATDLPLCSDTPLRKLSMKLIQRIGLTFLRPKLAAWRYQRGNRSLINNLGGIDKSLEGSDHSANDVNMDDDDDVPPEIEDVIEFLLQGLKDKDTIVRWSAAKGIGRVTGRLPRTLADDVVGAILEQFSIRESEKAWHGGCLALAELARRGLLLPERLPEVLPVLEKALVYDELRGQCSVGANIRDAACYLCWAFARAYHPDQLTDFVQQIATGLLIVSLFDREIPCRRAGSAAFQEHVGRQGNFPHGIEILTTVDYFAVGNRTNAYLNLSVDVGKYPEYTNILIDHLVEKKVGHWDSAVRELTAKALHNLAILSPEYMGKVILPKILSSSVGPVLVIRHGSVMSSGYIIHALFLKAKEAGKCLSEYVVKDTLEKVYDVVPTLDKNKLYRGMGGEYMRQASSILIEKCALAQIPIGESSDLLEHWHKLLEDCVINFEENIRLAALTALSTLWSQYYQPTTLEMISWRDGLVARYVKGLSSNKESQSLGYAAALGSMPLSLVSGKLDLILQALIEATYITSTTVNWAQKRKEAINSILCLSGTVGVTPSGNETECFCRGNLIQVFRALLNALDDYTMDRRGDIGAWVREASMQALQVLVKSVLEKEPSILGEELVLEMMTRVCQQSVERIDRTRKVGGTTFHVLLYSTPKLTNIPDVKKLEEIFSVEWCNGCNWASESATFEKFVDVLDLPTYRFRLLLGLTYALGGVSANLSRYTLEALQTYLNDRVDRKELLIDFLETILQIFKKYQKDDRVILPLIKSLSDLLSSCNALDKVLEEETTLVPQLLSCLRKECFKCTEYHKLSAIITTLCEMLRLETPSTKSILTQLSIFLGYQYPKVRALTATSLLTTLQDYSDRDIVSEEHLEELTSILEDTPWMDNMEQARAERNKVCQLIGLPVPQPKKIN